MTAYRHLLQRLYGLTRFGEKYSLDGPRTLHRDVGSPLESFDSILVGGTNGKGSTCAFLESCLRGAGLRVGLFTSPHLVSFRERIRIDGRPISKASLVDLAPAALNAADKNAASFFEATWAIAALAFRQAEVDVAVWEVGLGGRLDATNVAEPVVSAITNIGLDHTAILGPTLDDIAREKSAIFRASRPALTAASGAGLLALKKYAPTHLRSVGPTESIITPELPGAHQRLNAALAIQIASEMGVEPDLEAVAKTHWPGRIERFGNLVLDCAHNPAAIRALGQWVRRQRAASVHVIFGAMHGKDVSTMAQLVEAWADTVTLVTPNYPRRVEAVTLKNLFSEGRARVAASVREAVNSAPPDALTVVCGSGFLVGEVRATLTGQPYPEEGLSTTAR